jgi:hypothetical protein
VPGSASFFLLLFWRRRFAQTLLCQIAGSSIGASIWGLAKQCGKNSRSRSECALEPRSLARHGTDHCFPIFLNPLLLLFLVNHASALSSQQTKHFGYKKQPPDFIRAPGARGQCPRMN